MIQTKFEWWHLSRKLFARLKDSGTAGGSCAGAICSSLHSWAGRLYSSLRAITSIYTSIGFKFFPNVALSLQKILLPASTTLVSVEPVTPVSSAAEQLFLTLSALSSIYRRCSAGRFSLFWMPLAPHIHFVDDEMPFICMA